MLKPGVEIIKLHRGLHNFMGWKRPILTDSGGFQVFSLPKIRIDDEGVVFRSPIDGSKVFLNPEISMEVQIALGSDICMVFDHCPVPDADYEEVKEATERTYRWALRSKKAFKTENQALFGIVQGGIYPDLRRESALQLTSIGFDGYAIGGLSIGEERSLTLEMTEVTVEFLPEDKPRYFMGGGSPELILELVDRGGYVRQRLPNQDSKARNCAHLEWETQPQGLLQQAVPRTGGRKVRVLYLQEFHAVLHPSPLRSRRSPWADTPHDSQHQLHDLFDEGSKAFYREWNLQGTEKQSGRSLFFRGVNV